MSGQIRPGMRVRIRLLAASGKKTSAWGEVVWVYEEDAYPFCVELDRGPKIRDFDPSRASSRGSIFVAAWEILEVERIRA